jgi:hypothetical protein
MAFDLVLPDSDLDFPGERGIAFPNGDLGRDPGPVPKVYTETSTPRQTEVYLAKITAYKSNDSGAECVPLAQRVADTGAVQTVAESGVPQPVFIGACP